MEEQWRLWVGLGATPLLCAYFQSVARINHVADVTVQSAVILSALLHVMLRSVKRDTGGRSSSNETHGDLTESVNGNHAVLVTSSSLNDVRVACVTVEEQVKIRIQADRQDEGSLVGLPHFQNLAKNAVIRIA
jgi:hypothetical protein